MRNEFVNVAVVVYDLDSKELRHRVITDTTRLQAFFPGVSPSLVLETTAAFIEYLRQCLLGSDLEPALVKAVYYFAHTHTASSVGGGVGTDMELTLTKLYQRMIL
jgi:hypothetical protein